MQLKSRSLAGLAFATAGALTFTTAIPAVADFGAREPMSIEIDNDRASHAEYVAGTNMLSDMVFFREGDPIELPRDVIDPVRVEREYLELQFKQPGYGEAEVTRSDAGTVTYSSPEAAYKTHLQVLDSPDQSVLSDGIRSLIEIEDSSAPKEYLYETEISRGTRLAVQPDGGVVGTAEDGTITLVIPAPWAMDAEGESVPTHYQVVDNNLVQIVEFDSESKFPIVADPVWFIPLIVAGARVVGQVAVRAASSAAARAAAARAAAAAAAKRVVKTVSGRITSTAAKRCYRHGATIAGSTWPIYLEQRGNGSWRVKFSAQLVMTTISSATAACLLANAK